MSNQSSTTSRNSLPDLAYYDIHYADAIVLLFAALAEDERKIWSFENADRPACQDILTVTARRISLLKERYFQLKRTSNNLLLIAQVWMHDTSTHTQKQLEEEQQKYRKLRDDHHVPDREARALERLKDLRQAFNNAVKEYNNQWKWPHIARPRLSPLGSLSKLEAAANADQSHQSTDVADVTLQGQSSDEVRDLTDAASDQCGQSRVVADVKLQGPTSGEVRDSAKAASDQYHQFKVVGDVKLQGPPSGEVRDSANAASDQSHQFKVVADVKLQDPPSDEVRDSTDVAPDQSSVVADDNYQDFFTESDEVRGSTDASPVQSDQSNDDADVNFQDPTENGEIRSSTSLPKDQSERPDAVAAVNLQDSLTKSEQVRGSSEAALDQSDQPDTTANVNLQDPLTENDEVRGSDQEEENTLSGVSYASVYASSVQTLSAMLQEIDQHRRSINKEFIRSDDPLREHVMQVLKGASSHVSTVAKKWMKRATTDPVRYRTESRVLQTMRKDLHVFSLQRRVSGRLQELRSVRRVGGETSTDQHDDQYVDSCKTPHADGATCSQGFDTSSKSADYAESAHQPPKLDLLLRELKHIRSLQTSTNAPLFQEPEKKVTSQPTSQEPEGFQAHPEIANYEGSTTSADQEVFAQATSQQPEGFQAQTEIANHKGCTTSVNKEVITQVTNQQPQGFQAHPEIANHEGPDTSVIIDRQQVSEITTDAVQTFDSPHVANRPTSGIQTSTPDKKSRAKHHSIVCRWGGGMLRHTSQDIPDSLSCTLTSSSTVVESFDKPLVDSEPSETAEQTSHDADEFQAKFILKYQIEFEDLNDLSLDSDAPNKTSDADELETEYRDLNEPSSDSEAPDQCSDTDETKTVYQDLNEPSSDSGTPDQYSVADELQTAYQDLNEPSSDSEAPDQTSDGDELEALYQDLNEPSSDSDDPDQTSEEFAEDPTEPPCDAKGDQSSNKVYEPDQFDGPASVSDQCEEPACQFDQSEEPSYETDQFEEAFPDQGIDDADQFEEPFPDQDNDEADQFDESSVEQTSDEGESESEFKDYNEPSSDSDASDQDPDDPQQADSDADDYDEPVSDTEGPEEDISEADE